MIPKHTILPGVMTGDIGPKIRYNNMDMGEALGGKPPKE
jgi:hypothetical protein